MSIFLFVFQEPIKSRAPQLHLEYRFYKQLGNSGKSDSSRVLGWTEQQHDVKCAIVNDTL